MAGRAPLIVPVSELRRNMSRPIRQAERSHLPMFITQRGYVTMVLLSREEYDMLCVLRDKGLKAINPRMPVGEPLPSVREVEDEPEYWNDW